MDGFNTQLTYTLEVDLEARRTRLTISSDDETKTFEVPIEETACFPELAMTAWLQEMVA